MSNIVYSRIARLTSSWRGPKELMRTNGSAAKVSSEGLMLSVLILGPGPRSSVLGPGSWGLDPGPWVLGPGSWVLGPRSWVLGPRSSVLRGGHIFSDSVTYFKLRSTIWGWGGGSILCVCFFATKQGNLAIDGESGRHMGRDKAEPAPGSFQSTPYPHSCRGLWQPGCLDI